MNTYGEEFLVAESLTDLSYFDIPFPMKRSIVYDENTLFLLITVDYDALQKRYDSYANNQPNP